MAFSLDRLVQSQREAKALGPHPAFMGNDPVSVYGPGAPRQDATISQREASRHLQAYGGDQAIDWLYDCVGLYVDPVSTAPYRLRKKDGTWLVPTKTKGTPPDYAVGPQDLYRLLDAPNPYMLYDELMSLLVIDLLLVGNAYWFKWQVADNGRPLALYRLAPSHVKIVPGSFGPKGYEYQPPGAKKKLTIKPEQIIHFRRPNPHSAFYGLGVIQGGGRSMDLELAITDTVASYYENKADPSMIVQSERRVPRDVFNKLRAQLRARASGSSKAGELLVLEAGLKASTLSRSASDSMFKELSQMSQDRVYAKFRASRMLFGLMDEGGSSKISDARREFDNAALRPFMAKIARAISASLTSAWDIDYAIDYRQILPSEEATKVGESIATVPGIKVREVRRQYVQFGIEESTGDPELDERILNEPLGNLDANGQPLDPRVPSGPDQPLSSEPGRPPLPRNTSAIRGQKAFADIEARLEVLGLIEEAEKKAVSTPAPDNRLPGEVRPDDPFAGARASDINGAMEEIAAGLRKASVELERSLLDHVEGKALKTSDLVGRIKSSAAWQTFRDRITQVIEEGAARAAQSAVMHSKLSPDDDIDYNEIAKSVVHRPEGVRAIVRTLRDRVVRRVADAREANAERTEFEAAVRAAVAEWAASQAAMIADSEATEAYNEGTLTAAELSGVKSVYVIEEEDAPDQPCQDARGQVWDIKTARANRKEHPRCRRAFIPLTDAAVT